jgi:hypothetical protein
MLHRAWPHTIARAALKAFAADGITIERAAALKE